MTARRPLALVATLGLTSLLALAACGTAMHSAPEADLIGDADEAPSAPKADAPTDGAADAPEAKPARRVVSSGAATAASAPEAEPLPTEELAEDMPAKEVMTRGDSARMARQQPAAPRSAPAVAKRKQAARATAGPVPPPPPAGAVSQLAALGYVSGGAPAAGLIDTLSDDQIREAPAVPRPDADAVANTEEFTDHGVNPFTLVSEDALSTFSIDVDTAAYAIARRKLQAGALPPEAAVRVEEFVNYFDYDSYVTPQDDPFAVNMEAMPDPFRPGHHILRVGVKGKELSREERPPVHLTFLVDVSGSMSSRDKLPLAQRSMHLLVDTLREDDTVALATYAGRVARILPPTSAADKGRIHDAIGALQSGGSTAMSSGIDLAYQMAAETFVDGHENRVVVLSDGDANVGATSFDAMLSQIKGHADRGITLTTVGLGMGNYRDTLMEQLSNKGDGNNFYIDSPAMAQRVFVEEMGGAMITIARDVKLQVEFHPESVAAYRLIGYENRDVADRDFRNDRVDAGEVGSGHNVTALYDVILKEDHDDRLATVRMRYERPGADKGLTGEGATEKLWVFADRALKETPFQASRDTRIAYSAATFAEVLRGSPEAAEISLDALARFAEKSSRRGEKDDQELISLIRKAEALGAGQPRVAAR